MSTSIRLLILGLIFGCGAASGWLLNGWRLGTQLAACELRQAESAKQAEAYAETARLASQHQITKVEKVYVEKRQKQAAANTKITEKANALPDAPLLPYPYRVLHDYAATGLPTQEIANSNGTHGEGVAPRTLAKSVAENYAIARDSSARLEALQEIMKASGCFDLPGEENGN